MQELPNIKSRSQFRAPVKSQNKTVDEIVIGHAEGNITSGTCFHVLFSPFLSKGIEIWLTSFFFIDLATFGNKASWMVDKRRRIFSTFHSLTES